MSCYNFENCFKEMGRNQPWTQRLAVSKTIKAILVRLPVTNFKMTIWADCAVSPWSPYHWSKKVLAHWLLGRRGREWDFGLTSALPDTPVTASKIKQTFLSTNLHYWLLRGEQPDPTFHFKVICIKVSKLVTGIICKFQKQMKFGKKANTQRIGEKTVFIYESLGATS